ncbi:MAG: hypothetical protein HY372_04050 [Candidatus Andersenbacteria bacterium]|nr:hypothetical protein [Candidatus Andersenbacteria bacterium]
MQEVNRLGVRVVGITAVVLAVLFGLYWGARMLLRREGEVSLPAEPVTLAERQQDTDNDGVADLYETAYYNTDPTKPDTDGDGMNDLDEITAGRDPAVAGPKDESRPATGSAVVQQDTFTQRYLAGLPDDIARDQILDQARLEAFIAASRGPLLPELPEGTIKMTAAAGKEAVAAYLDAISAAHNKSLRVITSTDIEAAFRLQVQSSQPQTMRDLVIALTNNVGVLEAAAAPAEVVSLHTKLVAASRALRDNAAALRDIQQDFVGGLIAAKNIEELGGVFQEIAQEVQALEGKYGNK